MARTAQSYGTRGKSRVLNLNSGGGLLHLVSLIAMLVSLVAPLVITDVSARSPMTQAQASMLLAQQPLDKDIAGFDRVVAVGDFQVQLGCNAWDVNCAQSGLNNNSGFWTGVFALPPGSSGWQLVGIDATGTQYDLGTGQVQIAENQTGAYFEFNSSTRAFNVWAVTRVAGMSGSFGDIALAQDGDGFVASSVNVDADGPVDFQIRLDTGDVAATANLTAGSNRVSFDANGSVTNVQPLGNASVTVNRIDADGNPLPGSCFVLEGSSQTRGCDGDDGAIDGTTALQFIAGFQPGSFTLRETNPAEGQDAIADTSVELQSGQNPVPVQSAAPEPQTGDLVVQRLDENGNPVGGSCFEILDASGTSVSSACDEDGDVPDDGRVGLLAVPAGDYTLHESRTPDGYEPATDLQITVAPGQVTDQNVQSASTAPASGDLVVQRVDENGNPVGGSCFEILDASGTSVSSACDEDGDVPDDGRVGLLAVPVGDYTLRETRTPEGYEPGADTPVTVSPDQVTDQNVASALIPVVVPTEIPTEVPTEQPTEAPTELPTEVPTDVPTESPTEVPTEATQLGDIVIYRTDEAGNPIGGACFAAVDANNQVLGEQCDEDGIAADDGTTGIFGVPVGTQTIRETRTPDGYSTAPDASMVVQPNVQTEITISAPIVAVPTAVATEPPAPTPTIATTVVPTDQPQVGASLIANVPVDDAAPQVCIELDSGGSIGMLEVPYGCDNGDNDADATAGVIRLNDLPAGDLLAVVYQGPDELVQADPIPVTLTAGESTVIDLVPAAPVETSFTITTSDGTNPVGGACYSVDDGEAVCDDGSGTLTISGIAPGDHTVTMTAAPDGFTMADPSSQTISVAPDGSTNVAYTVVASTTAFTITTSDGTNPVGGACYSVDDGEAVCDDGSGTLTISGIVPGDHTVIMTAAPDGFTMADPNSQPVTVAPDGSTSVAFTISAVPVTVDVTVNTVDEVSGEPIPGACYSVNAGDPVCDQTASGSVVIQGVNEGQHVLVMTVAPDGYQAAENTSISTDSPVITVPLVAETGSLSVAMTDSDQNPVVGACVSIDGGEAICDEDSDGIITQDALSIGDHSVAVVSVPEGYVVPEAPQTATVSTAETAQIAFALADVPPATGGLDIAVYYSDDAPVVGACITISQGTTQIARCDGDANDSNPEDGVVGFEALAPGQYEVALTPGYEPDRPVDDIVPVSVEVTAGERATANFTLPLQPTTGSLVLVTTSDGRNVAGACFTVGDVTVCDGDDADVDGTDGVVQIDGLQPDTYVVSMTAPAGFQPAANQNATILAGETAQLNFAITAIPQPGEIRVVTLDSNGDALNDACYAVVQQGSTIATQCDTSDGSPHNGEVIFQNLPAGTYQVVQTQAPSSNLQKAPTQTVTVEPGERTELEITMNLKPGRLTVTTVDRDEQTLILQNACFTLTGSSTFGPFCDADDGAIDGRVVFTNVPAGNYALHQTVATAGYELASDRDVNITAGGALQITVQNSRVQPPAENGTLVVIPLDPNGNPVAGGCYQVFNGDTPVSQRVCDNADDTAARVTIADLPVGDFTLREMLAPSPDWQIAADMSFSVRNGETTTVEVPHVYKNGSLVIQAVNSVGLPLQGACFTLSNAGDIEICTDGSGQATVSDLTPGKRDLTQTKAPFGFKLITTPREVAVRPGQTTTVRVVFENERPPNTGTLQIQKFVCPAGDEGERTKFLGGAQGNAELKQTAGCVPAVATFTWVAEDGSTGSNTTFQTNKDGRAQIASEEGIFLLTETDPDLPGNSAARVRIGTGQMTTVIVLNFVAPPKPEPVTINVEGYTCAPGFAGSSFADFQASCMTTSQLTNQITVRAEGANRYKQITGDGGTLGKTSFNDLPPGTFTIWAERSFTMPLSYMFCGVDANAPTQKAVNGTITTTQAEGSTILCRVFQVPSLFDANHGAIQVQKFNCPIEERQRGFDYKNECARATEPLPFEIQQIDIRNGATIGEPVRVSTNGDGIVQFPMLAAGTYKLTEVDSSWCFAQSNSVDAAGNVVVKNNSLSEVWVYNCVGAKNPPNTGSGDAAGLMNPEPNDSPGSMQVIPNLIWPPVLLAGWIAWRERRSA